MKAANAYASFGGGSMLRFHRALRFAVVAVAWLVTACASTDGTFGTFSNAPVPGYVPPAPGTIFTYQNEKFETYQRHIVAVDGPITTEQASSGKVTKRVADILGLADSSGVPLQHDADLNDLWPLEVGKSAYWRVFQHGGLASEGTVKIVGRERVRVRNQEYDTFVMKIFWSDPRWKWTGEVTRWMAPEIGRWVKYTEVMRDIKGNVVRQHETRLIRIRRLGEM